MDIEVIEVPFNGTSVKVVEAQWTHDAGTVIEVWLKTTNERAEVIFSDDIGLRILDELDVAGFWLNTPKTKLAESWLFKVNRGGWFDFEATREDFYSKYHAAEITEYLVAGYQECVSVLSRSAPIVRVLMKLNLSMNPDCRSFKLLGATYREKMMLMRKTLALLVAMPAVAMASDALTAEAFASEMISCAYQNATYGLGPGTASAAQKAQAESVVYLDAAQKATSYGYVEAQKPAVQKAAQEAVLKEVTNAKDVDAIVAKWNDVKSHCDASLKAYGKAQ
ncbi:hypothetical protein [Noviherbaspirillum massiliense]|uniref:hypothetical protein n=1 Tax=Noviherbaspirillum massiliense TaxID=1465823 RepID=UPI0003718016|nr:hypothetical protein [Noviherbaspirillum massiliense]